MAGVDDIVFCEIVFETVSWETCSADHQMVIFKSIAIRRSVDISLEEHMARLVVGIGQVALKPTVVEKLSSGSGNLAAVFRK